MDYLTGDSEDPSATGIHSHLWWMDGQLEEKFFRAEAGVYRPKQTGLFGVGDVNASEYASVAVSFPEPRLPGWRTRLVQVCDDSLQAIDIRSGDVATVALPPGSEMIPLVNGLLVAVTNSIRVPFVEETSIRQVLFEKNKLHLVTRSSTNYPAIELDEYDIEPSSPIAYINNIYVAGNNNNSVSVEGVVTRITRQIPLGDLMREISYEDD